MDEKPTFEDYVKIYTIYTSSKDIRSLFSALDLDYERESRKAIANIYRRLLEIYNKLSDEDKLLVMAEYGIPDDKEYYDG